MKAIRLLLAAILLCEIARAQTSPSGPGYNFEHVPDASSESEVRRRLMVVLNSGDTLALGSSPLNRPGSYASALALADGIGAAECAMAIELVRGNKLTSPQTFRALLVLTHLHAEPGFDPSAKKEIHACFQSLARDANRELSVADLFLLVRYFEAVAGTEDVRLIRQRMEQGSRTPKANPPEPGAGPKPSRPEPAVASVAAIVPESAVPNAEPAGPGKKPARHCNWIAGSCAIAAVVALAALYGWRRRTM